jgi:hypothetical protein
MPRWRERRTKKELEDIDGKKTLEINLKESHHLGTIRF